ncbi:MAG: hypothetical protein EB148_04095 [Actinobacteria bacterium]|nr:hypothetical protein [Acidimicrobiia bacterium]NDC10888.1 hypothetical protein [Actinomycetota bacterium]NDF23641.1 hypothetical protein [Actinomycetota bacterium]NDI14804.1 hypothetical protein [Actinomycetota bacterium]
MHTVGGAPLKLLKVPLPSRRLPWLLGYEITAVPVGATPAGPSRNTGAGGSLVSLALPRTSTPAAATVATSACGAPRVKNKTAGTLTSVSNPTSVMRRRSVTLRNTRTTPFTKRLVIEVECGGY